MLTDDQLDLIMFVFTVKPEKNSGEGGWDTRNIYLGCLPVLSMCYLR